MNARNPRAAVGRSAGSPRPQPVEAPVRMGGLGALGDAPTRIGISENRVVQYETEVTNDNSSGLPRARHDVERAKGVLHQSRAQTTAVDVEPGPVLGPLGRNQ